MATSNYYIFKYCQGIAAFVFIFKIFTTSELCGEFVGKQYLLETTRECRSMTLFGLNFNGGGADQHQGNQPTQFWRINTTSNVKDLAAEVFPIRNNVCLNISLTSSYSIRFFTFTLPTEPRESVADEFVVPIFCSIFYVLHFLIDIADPFPNIPCKYIMAVIDIIRWTIIYLYIAMLRTNWDDHWLCSNFKAVIPDVVFWSLFISSAQVIGCAFEILFIRQMLKAERSPLALLSNAKKLAAGYGMINKPIMGVLILMKKDEQPNKKSELDTILVQP